MIMNKSLHDTQLAYNRNLAYYYCMEGFPAAVSYWRIDDEGAKLFNLRMMVSRVGLSWGSTLSILMIKPFSSIE